MEELAHFYRIHPGLYMERAEMMERLGLNDADLDKCLAEVEAEKLVALYRKRGNITLAKATYEGLRKAKPKEYYTFYPEFVDMDREVF